MYNYEFCGWVLPSLNLCQTCFSQHLHVGAQKQFSSVMPNSPLLLNYLIYGFGTHFLQESRSQAPPPIFEFT